jgi:hypothetical protein
MQAGLPLRPRARLLGHVPSLPPGSQPGHHPALAALPSSRRGSFWWSLRSAAEDPRRQVVNALLALNVVTFVMAQWDRGVARSLALVPALVWRGEAHRLLTAGFLHTNALHLAVGGGAPVPGNPRTAATAAGTASRV